MFQTFTNFVFTNLNLDYVFATYNFIVTRPVLSIALYTAITNFLKMYTGIDVHEDFIFPFIQPSEEFDLSNSSNGSNSTNSETQSSMSSAFNREMPTIPTSVLIGEEAYQQRLNGNDGINPKIDVKIDTVDEEVLEKDNEKKSSKASTSTKRDFPKRPTIPTCTLIGDEGLFKRFIDFFFLEDEQDWTIPTSELLERQKIK